MSDIKTLDEILAQMGHPICAKSSRQATKTTGATKKTNTAPTLQQKKQPVPKQKSQHQAKSSPSAISLLLNDTHQSVLDDKTLQLLSAVEIQKLDTPDRDTRYLRWLAFYYLSRRELSAWQLKQKLLAKDCDADAIDALLAEFAEKGYQSDERCAIMLVREAVRKGRGIRHLDEQLKKAKLDARDFGGLDALLHLADMASISSDTILEGNIKGDIDWLQLAVEARCRKYGDTIPTDPKEKARQLRFLQYRGFDIDVCFNALKMTLENFDD